MRNWASSPRPSFALAYHLDGTFVLSWLICQRDSITCRVLHAEETTMRLLAICWTAGWIIAGIYIADKKGRSKARAAIDALLFGPFVLLLTFAKQAKKK